MKCQNEFTDLVLERLAPLGHVRAKPMFGGYGIYLEDLFFALIADDELYLKVDDGNRGYFEERGIQPFHYRAKSKDIVMSYYPIPEDVFEDQRDVVAWARHSIEAALRARATKPAKRPAGKKKKSA